MAKYKVGDIFINHKDGKILQVCGGICYEDCCYNKVYSKKPCLEGVSCFSLIGLKAYFKELPSLPPGTKIKVREDLKEGTKYGVHTFVNEMQQYKEVTIKQYNATSKGYDVIENIYIYTLEMFDQVINKPKINNMEQKKLKSISLRVMRWIKKTQPLSVLSLSQSRKSLLMKMWQKNYFLKICLHQILRAKFFG